MNGLKHVVPRAKRVNLAKIDTASTGGLTKEQAQEEVRALRDRISELQDLLYADARFALLVIFQAIDAGGKDGAIRSAFGEVDPIGVNAYSFGVPTKEELAHHFLWRYQLRLPGKRELAIFNRSHYESVLVERVKQLVPKEVWRARYAQINDFDAALVREGTVILKFFLHISKEEQRERLQARVDDPKKRWKFRLDDLEERKLWDDYQLAFVDMLYRCSTKAAPWHVIPADHKWYRDVAVARAIVARLESLNLRYPEPEEGVAGLKIE